MSAQEPGWYPDPGMPGDERYWDGAQWTPKRRFASFETASPEHVRSIRTGRPKPKPNAFTRDLEGTRRPRGRIVAAAVVALIVVIWLFNRGDDTADQDIDLTEIPTGPGFIEIG